jgi:hypothetical protein
MQGVDPQDVGGAEHRDGPHGTRGERQRRCAREAREQRAFDEQLPDKPPSAGAKRAPHGHLLGARRATRQEQVRDVDARDEQHDQDRGGEETYGSAHIADEVLAQRQDVHAASTIRSRLFDLNLRGHGVELGTGSFERRAWRKASDHLPVAARPDPWLVFLDVLRRPGHDLGAA